MLKSSLLFISLVAILALASDARTVNGNDAKIPVIIETDIGQFMDDAWALTFLLKDPQVDIRLIVVSTNNTELRAQIVAKLCASSSHKSIPIAIGDKTSDYAGPQSHWAASYNLTSYPGSIIRTSASIAVATVLKSALLAGERVHLVELSPPIVFSEVAQTYPDLVSAATVYAGFMGGCFKYGYGHSFGQTTEYNAKFNITATDRLLRAQFATPLQLSPLDTSAQVKVTGDNYQRVLVASQKDGLVGALVESFRVWWRMCPHDPLGIMCPQNDPESYTSSLFDLQAAAFASSYAGSLRKFVVVEKNQPVAVNATGFTNIVSEGSPTDIFMEWNDLPGFMTEVIDVIVKDEHEI